MILLCGIPSEPPLSMIHDRLEESGDRYLIFNQRRFAETEFRYEIDGGSLSGHIFTDGRRLPLEDVTGVYLRLMDDRLLPELKHESAHSQLRRSCRILHDALTNWSEIAPIRVVNRSAAMATNSSKPFQAQIIRDQGFSIPETLITNVPELVREFLAKHRRVIYKSISGARSIVKTLSVEDFESIERIRACPTQFQALVDGSDVRVHTIGERFFATLIDSSAIDYRYARKENTSASLSTVQLDDDIASRCVKLASVLGLDFAGIDLRISDDGEIFCFEVNPCPAYSYYEAQTGQPISGAVAEYLGGKRGALR